MSEFTKEEARDIMDGNLDAPELRSVISGKTGANVKLRIAPGDRRYTLHPLDRDRLVQIAPKRYTAISPDGVELGKVLL